MYYSLSYIMSFVGFCIFLIIGARGIGKTFSIKKHIIKDFIYKGRQFVIIRDTKDACEELAKDNGATFFGDVCQKVNAFKKLQIEVKDFVIYINGNEGGRIMPLSLFYKFKGNAYPNVYNIFWDEFIPENCQRYLGNRARQFVNTIQTIGRTRKDYRIFLTANALDIGNDILELFNFNIKTFGIYKNKKKQAILHYAPNNPQFDKATEESIAGKIVSGTFLDATINKNEFEGGNIQIFEKRKPCDIYGIYYNSENDCFRLYKAKDDVIYYVCKDINANSYNYMRYVFNYSQVDTIKQYATKEDKEFLKRIYEMKQVQFESQFLANVYVSIIQQKGATK